MAAMHEVGGEARDVIDARLLKALGHPLRMRLLMRFNERVASPVELSKELGEPLGTIAYHTRTLLNLGYLELVRTAQRRGAIEHYYRAVARPFFSARDWAALPASARHGISGAVLQRAWSDTAAALQEGTFDARDDRHLSRTHLVLDEQGWSELTGLLAGLLDRALEIQAESAGRLVARDGAGTDGEFLSSLLLMHFPRPSAPSRSSGS
jgi:DNA-binding transcriptional ArsR family regulator